MFQNSIHNYIFFVYYRSFSVLDSRWKKIVTASFARLQSVPNFLVKDYKKETSPPVVLLSPTK